jgi:hypothetical protein
MKNCNLSLSLRIACSRLRHSDSVLVYPSVHVPRIFRLNKFSELPTGVCSETLDIPVTTSMS